MVAVSAEGAWTVRRAARHNSAKKVLDGAVSKLIWFRTKRTLAVGCRVHPRTVT
jgi:hypothetical protein